MTRPARAGVAGLLSILVLGLAACASSPAETGASAGPTVEPTPTTGPTATPKPTQTQKPQTPTPTRTAVGKIKEVINEDGYVDDQATFLDDAVYRGSTVRTDDQGAIRFGVTGAVSTCTMQQRSEVQVVPQPDIAVQLHQGTVECMTEAGQSVTLQAGITATISSSGDQTPAVLAVTIDGDHVTVGVAAGSAEVRSLLNPEQAAIPLIANTTAVFIGRQLPIIDYLEVNQFGDVIRQAIDEDKTEALPPVTGSLPDATGSKVLGAISDTGTMTVGIDSRLADSPQATEFINQFVAELEKQWGVHVDRVPVPSDAAQDALASGQIQAWMSPDQLENAGEALQLASAPDGRPIWMTTADAKLADAQKTLLRNLMDAGAYTDLYRRSFQVQRLDPKTNLELNDISRLTQTP
jgi:hypothetical protein